MMANPPESPELPQLFWRSRHAPAATTLEVAVAAVTAAGRQKANPPRLT